MGKPTDSDLGKKWEATKTRLAGVNGKEDAVSRQVREDVMRQQSFIRIEWAEILERKRRGELTDRLALDFAIQAARGLSLVHGVPLRFEEEEGPRNEANRARFWFLIAIHEGSKVDFNEARFNRLIEAATEELLQLKLIVTGDLCRGTRKKDGRAFVGWAVKTWLWDGPA